eukprot:CAMPEP_0119105588 /NCGR_PEP_ID=MMETSP1180-20130426/3505_1 /TAXON_ID=3052 ORGANISM="Chlamydomonas cf sp, Strain CCMP681" /NCGR_SAMPLE_ID=MMETSP1180 /ASSEMBLY_ACC=CAM_ASM_000741 /LENGTH=54 /DNA_ID=CAMNT_0007090673 /DNA_START=496 /DNA_END=660 /DNA_ORIENTATION=-
MTALVVALAVLCWPAPVGKASPPALLAAQPLGGQAQLHVLQSQLGGGGQGASRQ